MVFAFSGDSHAVWAVVLLSDFSPRRPAHRLGLFAIVAAVVCCTGSAIPTSRLFLISCHSDRPHPYTDRRGGNDVISRVPLFGIAWVVETTTAISCPVAGVLVDLKRHA